MNYKPGGDVLPGLLHIKHFAKWSKTCNFALS